MKKTNNLKFRIVDALLIALMLAPIAAGILLKVLTTPASEDIEITGARIFFEVPLPLQNLQITESQINSWIVICFLFGLSCFLTHGISGGSNCTRHLVAEWIVEKTDKLVGDNMDPYFHTFAPFVCAIMGLSACSSLLTLVGLFPPTSDINVVGGWAILVFLMIEITKLKAGIGHYLKSFGDPVPFLSPFNVISEIATPISMSFRHYGNVLSGVVISALVTSALQGLSKRLLGWLPGTLGQFPFLQIGLPAVLSVYFDVFSGCMQAFIFAMLTMLYISGGLPQQFSRES